MTSKTNGATIRKAFNRIKKSKNDAAFSGLKELLKDAMEWAMLEHDEGHQLHIVLGDNYGWCIVHDGKVKAIQVKAPANRSGVAERELRSISAGLGDGWHGVLMAGMGDNKTYYSVRYETGILESTIDFTEANFNKYFRKI